MEQQINAGYVGEKQPPKSLFFTLANAQEASSMYIRTA